VTARRVGVEEEFLLVDGATGAPAGVAGQVLRRTPPAAGAAERNVDKELTREQVETGTPPVHSLAELRAEIRRLRAEAGWAAQSTGHRLAALATSPVPADPTITPDPRYEQLMALYGVVAAEQLACGMHVHVETASPAEAVGALDRVRPWLPILLALSTNSPYWHGQDTGHDSYRSQVWARWPVAGPTEVFGSERAYRQALDAALATGALLDDGMAYFDARLGRGLPTLELRVADVCLYADDAVLLAALARALVDTAARGWAADRPPQPVRTEVLRLAMWRAGRSGITDELVDPLTGAAVAAWTAIDRLRSHVRDSLEDAGDLAVVDDLLGQLKGRGTGAAAQRAAYTCRENLGDVALDAADRTVPT